MNCPADFIATLTDVEVTFLLEQDPLGVELLYREEDRGERRWFLFELFRARPYWFGLSMADIAAIRRNEEAQLALL